MMDGDAEALALARGQLSGAGLLRPDPVQIHPLLAAFARSQDGAAERLPAVAEALAFRFHMPLPNTGLPANFAPLRAHVEIAAAHADAAELAEAACTVEQPGLPPETWSPIISAARRHFERALAIDERVYGPNHPNVAIRANNLGALL